MKTFIDNFRNGNAEVVGSNTGKDVFPDVFVEKGETEQVNRLWSKILSDMWLKVAVSEKSSRQAIHKQAILKQAAKMGEEPAVSEKRVMTRRGGSS